MRRDVMRISSSKSQTMVLSQQRVECPTRVEIELLPNVEQFRYLGVSFTSEVRMEGEIDRLCSEEGTEPKRRYSRFTGQSTFLPTPMVMFPPHSVWGLP